MTVRLAWAAGPDGIGHVHIAASLRTGCGRRPVAERDAWPIESRCVACATAAEMASPALCPHCRKPMRRAVPMVEV